MPLVASVLPGTQQVRIYKFVSSVDLENFASRHLLFRRLIKLKIKNLTCATFLVKVRYVAHLCFVFERSRVLGLVTVNSLFCRDLRSSVILRGIA